jgi:hypothetical protein
MIFMRTKQTNHAQIREDNDVYKTNIYISYLVISKIQLTSMFVDIYVRIL